MATAEMIRSGLAERLAGVAAGALPSSHLADWAYSQWMVLMEGELKEEDGAEAQLLTDILGDISAQWEILGGNAYLANGPEAAMTLRFPPGLLASWSSQLERYPSQGAVD